MPRVTISISGPNRDADNQQDLLTLDLPPGLTVKDLKAFVEAETTFPADTQRFFLNGQALANDVQTLEDAGIKDGEMLALLIRRPPQGPSQPTPSQVTGNRDGTSNSHLGGRPDPEAIRQSILGNPGAQAALRNQAPELFAALNDRDRWRNQYLEMARQEQERDRERDVQYALLNEDPFNPEAQQKIEELIRRDRIAENLQHAYENNPEFFSQVHMLYINAEVNGHPIKAFVDSGAQSTIMSPSAAEKCGIMRLMDTRFGGIAKGVGTAKILGRVHSAEIKIGGAVMPCAFTVMEGKDVELLFGLDMLRRYKMKIDLEKNALCFENIEVPFLAEHDIPKALVDAELDEPTIPGPDGTEIGARSGTVRPAGSHSKAPAQASSAPGPAAAGPSTAPQPSPSNVPPAADIEQLTNLGFPRQAAIQALQAAGGNVELAATLLLENS